jgi:Cu/Ag efflux protein CusF
MAMDRLAIAGVLALTMLWACSPGPKPAPPTQNTATTREGDTVERAHTTTVQAKVIAIDHQTRMVTLERADGEKVGVRVDEKVKNLDQVRKGDMVTAVYRRAVAARLMKRGEREHKKPVVAGGIVTAPPGEKPAAISGEVVEMTATVLKVDRETQEVSLKGPQGNTVKVAVEDPAILARVKKGDRVDVTYTESLAVSVDKPAK